MTDDFLHRYFLNNSGKRIHKWFHYFDIYERHLARFRGQSPVMLEIGVAGGGSLHMWRDYFGPGCRILGIDINEACAAHRAADIDIFIGSQDDPKFIDKVLSKYPRVDIVLDDGSHRMDHLTASFELLYHRVHEHGVYLAEDLHTCYWDKFGGGLRREGTFMEFVKDKLDELHAHYLNPERMPTPFAKATGSINCYDSMVVFERGPQGTRQALVTKGPAAS